MRRRLGTPDFLAESLKELTRSQPATAPVFTTASGRTASKGVAVGSGKAYSGGEVAGSGPAK